MFGRWLLGVLPALVFNVNLNDCGNTAAPFLAVARTAGCGAGSERSPNI